jgi:endonuclease/exonuclease/phosphatase family metal-dependent hydrolase
MRLATFNILGGRAPGDDRVDVARFAAAVAALDADLLALQEVDRDQPRSQHLDLTAVAAEAMGASEHLFAPALTGTPGESWAAAAVDGDHDGQPGPAYGVALLSRHPVTAWQVVRLPAAPIRIPYRWPQQWRPDLVRDEPRVAIVADIVTPLGPLRVVSAHLSFLPGWNRHQLCVLLRALGPGPVVLAGDLNLGRRLAERITRMRPLVTGPTLPADAPTASVRPAGRSC